MSDFSGFPATMPGVAVATNLSLLSATRINGDARIDELIAADQTDWNPSGLSDAQAIFVTQYVGVGYKINSLAGGAIKVTKVIVNDDPDKNLTLTHQHGGSTAANRFNFTSFNGGSDIVLAPSYAAALEYDPASSRWICAGVAIPYPLANEPGEPGLPGLEWRGQWIVSPATAYNENDGVFNEGQSYIALGNHTSSILTEPGVGANWETVWDLLAEKGADGAGAVDTVFGRSGTVVATAGDYVASEIDNDSVVSGSTVEAALNALNSGKASTAALSTAVQDQISGAASKTTPVDADKFGLVDSESSPSGLLKYFTWANLKASLWSALGALINGGTGKTTPVDADTLALSDSAASNATKKLTWANLKATLKTYFDTLYASLSGAIFTGAVQVTTVEVGHASDTTLSRSSAGLLAVEGVPVAMAGRQTIWIPAAAMTARTTNGAAAGSVEMSTNKNMFITKDFDTTTQEFVQFEIFFPKSWNLGTVTFQPVWSHPSTSTNFGVVWGLAGVARSDDDAGDVAFGTAQTSTDTGGTTNDIYIGPESSAITIAGTPAAGDSVQFQLSRNPSDGSDTLAVDARLHGIKVFFTTNAATDA